MIGINFTPILDVPVPFMLDANPADLDDELDAVNAACLRWINFHTSMKTIFGQTRDRSSMLPHSDVTLHHCDLQYIVFELMMSGDLSKNLRLIKQNLPTLSMTSIEATVANIMYQVIMAITFLHL